MWEEILSRLNSIRSLCHMSGANKEFRTMLRENVWLWHHAVLSTCGTPLPRDCMYLLKLHVCPWLSFPRAHRFEHIASDLQLKGVSNMRFEGNDALVVTLYLKHRADYVVYQMDAVVSVSTFAIHYGPRVEVAHHDYCSRPSSLRYLDLEGRSLRIDVPEEIVCSCRGVLDGIRCVVLHDSAVALHAGGDDNTSDVYVFSTAGRLLRRIHVSRDTQEVRVCCSGSAMAILRDNYDGSCVLQLYAPEAEERIVLRRRCELV